MSSSRPRLLALHGTADHDPDDELLQHDAAPRPMSQNRKTCLYAARVNTSVVLAGPPLVSANIMSKVLKL